jgi:3-oxoacyl-(acyl-carrier-protein) synthase
MTESTPDFPTKIGFLGLINISGGSVAHRMKIQKYLSTDATACVSSLKCIQDAELLIASGIIEKAVILGWDYQVSSCTREVFGKLGASITKEEYENGRVPSAFRKGNGGFLIGAGIGYIVLEKECENPIAKVASISTQFFSDGNPLSVDSEGYINVMETAYNESGYSEINVLKSHGTGTCANNEAEGNAIEKVLGDRCIVTSYKPIIGHTMGASGAIELSMILDDYKRGNITGILNKEDHPQYINKDTPPSGNIFMCNAAGMGGVYTSMVGEYYER